jgi:transcription elongation factor GreA
MSTVVNQAEPITREGYERLRAELDHLVTTRRGEMADALREARDDGRGPDENAGLAAVLDDHVSLERRIEELQTTLSIVRVVESPEDGVAGIGQRVRIRLSSGGTPAEYHLVGPIECDPARRRISVTSPVGCALIGQRAGDVVEVETPGGTRTFEILEVRSGAR